jgi:hypothetical protein
MSNWGRWQCPYDDCDNEPLDHADIHMAMCGVEGHVVLLGQIENGRRLAIKHDPDSAKEGSHE